MKLKMGGSFTFDAGLGCYTIDLGKLDAGKTGHSALVKLPREENKLVDRWLKVSRSPLRVPECCAGVPPGPDQEPPRPGLRLPHRGRQAEEGD